jgi:hypothetical protein
MAFICWAANTPAAPAPVRPMNFKKLRRVNGLVGMKFFSSIGG